MLYRTQHHLAKLILLAVVPLLAQSGPQSAERLFAVEVKPLLAEKCLACHGAEPVAILGGLDLTSRESMLRGGASSRAVLVPGNAVASLIYEAVRRSNPKLQMPLKDSDRLTEEQVWKIRDWINAGAPWPDAETERAYVQEDLARARTSAGVTVATRYAFERAVGWSRLGQLATCQKGRPPQ